MAILLVPFICLAMLGLVLSLIAHVSALLGMPQPLGSAAWGLHIGIFVVWLPAVITANRLVKDFRQKDFWKAALRGCPAWLRWLTYAFFAYAIINFVTFIVVAPRGKQDPAAPTPPVVFRGFSGHWMAFYSAAAAILYSALVVRRHDPSRRCPNQHPVSPAASYCQACGAYVGEPTYADSSQFGA
jgi:hypothetical protein